MNGLKARLCTAPGIKRAEQIKSALRAAVRSPAAIRCASDEGLFTLEAEERGEGIRNEVLGLKLKTFAGCWLIHEDPQRHLHIIQLLRTSGTSRAKQDFNVRLRTVMFYHVNMKHIYFLHLGS